MLTAEPEIRIRQVVFEMLARDKMPKRRSYFYGRSTWAHINFQMKEPRILSVSLVAGYSFIEAANQPYFNVWFSIARMDYVAIVREDN